LLKKKKKDQGTKERKTKIGRGGGADSLKDQCQWADRRGKGSRGRGKGRGSGGWGTGGRRKKRITMKIGKGQHPIPLVADLETKRMGNRGPPHREERIGGKKGEKIDAGGLLWII